MKNLRKVRVIFFAGLLLVGILLLDQIMAYGQDTGNKSRFPEGVYMELTKDFYEVMREGRSMGDRSYSNDQSNEYLRQIAISTRFMVETNLQILRQQERIIQLLHSLLEDKKR